jgi:NitT/TauT family transport system ATP-binding protein
MEGELPVDPMPSREAPAALSFSGIKVNYGTVPVIDDVSFDIEKGSFVALIGPSGCGKTTFLNLAAGLMAPDSGEVAYHGRPLLGPNTAAGYLTQEDALLPWRSVLANVALPLEIKGIAKSEREDRAAELLRKVGLAGFEKHKPRQLSGGMRKRVSLARTLVYRPETLLLDEPFSALDAQTRVVIQEQLIALCREFGLTVLLVTHDIAEAVGLADRVVLFSRRPATVCDMFRIEQPPNRVLTHVDAKHEAFFDRVWAHLREQMSEMGSL